ncbi:cyclic nucleotide-binding domain-containing protein [Brachyspira murdochii]|uniref:Putative transcriptional regulator, Crp/Fnr family n=1 Tax=Brachyspira murdochii (strain ATCC 51284 / DSM 12563 / 56-150) TaxID=526224 RepID=D5U7P3_BRAM5|nr:cyclic nucleotide-binding domain-containing protein [Brachyspira murdochii]ADG72839.1 putative transcriptional regulator, Crp/Fnr family [Brachyspira murdochii DSM 12563]
MSKYDIIKFNKDDIIIKSGEKPSNYFYIITKGKTLCYNDFYKSYKYNSEKGSILGLVSSVIDEPYFSNIEVIEETEVIKIKTDSIININNEELLYKIYDYLYLVLETWLSKYYTILAKNKVDLYNKDDILTMIEIYKNNGYTDVVYKMAEKYLQIFPDNNDIDEIKKILNNIKPSEKPKHIGGTSFKFKKGYCLYSEIDPANHIYIITSGKIGIYSILNKKQIIRSVYSNGYIINGYPPSLEYKPLLTTAVILEDAVIEIISKKDLVKMIDKDRALRMDFIKMAAMKVYNAVLKIKSINTKELNKKLIIIIYSIIKMETLFCKDMKTLKLLYKIDDIKNMLNINNSDKDIYSQLQNIKYIEIDNLKNIKVSDVINYIKKYKNYIF